MKVTRSLLFGIPFRLFSLAFIFVFALMEAQKVANPQSLSNAEEFYQATLYSKAIPLYTTILEELIISQEKLSDPQEAAEMIKLVNCRIGQSYFFEDKFTEALDHFEKMQVSSTFTSPFPQTPLDLPIYLYAKSCRYLSRHQQAIALLKEALPIAPASNQPELRFELGLNYFLAGELSLAKQQFTFLHEKYSKKQLGYLSNLYLSRILLAEGALLEASNRLEAMEKKILPNNLLYFELTYLQGETAFYLQDYPKAIRFFEMTLPQRNRNRADWNCETLYYLGWSLLKAANSPSAKVEEQKLYFEKAEDHFTKLVNEQPDEKVYLALAQCHLMKASILKEKEAYSAAEAILSNTENFKTLEAKTHALLLRAEAASTYEERKKYYGELTHESNATSPFYTNGWYLRGINDYEEGLTLSFENRSKIFLEAAKALEKAFSLLQIKDPVGSALAFKYQIEAYYHDNSDDSLLTAYALTKNLFKENQDGGTLTNILTELQEPQELYYLAGMVACNLAEKNKEYLEFAETAEQILRKSLVDYPSGYFADLCLNLLATFYIRNEDFLKAEESFALLAKEYPNSINAGGALYWAAICAEKLKKEPAIIKEYRSQLFEKYPSSSFAPDAYFHYYSYRDYLQGDRISLKHLQSFSDKFPESPLQINANYLIGLDCTRERKSNQGRTLRKKNLMHAIQAFFQAETQFDTLNQEQKISPDKIEHYAMLQYRAMLERALANQLIAEESQATKRAIYAQYARELFLKINRELADPNSVFGMYLIQGQAFPRIQEESLYLLAQNYLKFEEDTAAEQTIDGMITKYKNLSVSKGYYLSRIYYEKAMIEMRQEKYDLALQDFMLAEVSDEERYLNADQKLDLWIQQSLAYKALNQMDNSMLILSKVINAHTISSLRIKAMYLRAEIYSAQGRHDLARKQLEATSKKGGKWATKAKAKLDADYGYL
ncbi:MAG: hypothetical protein H0T62_00195 [Parachlamydiaceae bacterium]|nr:hypothetical protein [Parachlamydiaceae bacterium]